MVSIFSPAKINLMLSVHAQRADGFHELSSIIAALDFGDSLEVNFSENSDSLVCDDPLIPVDQRNLILQAAELLRASLGHGKYFSFKLLKNIPVGAGLGGGSSNAVAAVRGMLILLDIRLADSKIQEIVSKIGSDCSFFVNPAPSLMTGRGEVIEQLDSSLTDRIKGRALIVFKPEYSISTQEAYSFLVEDSFESETEALKRLKYADDDADFCNSVLYNSFLKTTRSKYLALGILLDLLNSKGFPSLMSGSGSACFSLLSPGNDAKESHCIREIIMNSLGENVFLKPSLII